MIDPCPIPSLNRGPSPRKSTDPRIWLTPTVSASDCKDYQTNLFIGVLWEKGS